MKQSLTLLAMAVVVGIAWGPKQALGQNSKEVRTLQLDIYEVSHKVDTFQTNQAERMEELKTLLKQSMEANTKLSAEMKAMQDSMRSNQAEQQNRLFEPLAAMKTGVTQVSDDVAAVQNNIADMRKKLAAQEEAIKKIEGTVNLIYQQALTPPAPVAAVVPAGPTPEQAVMLLFGSAQSRRLAGDLPGALNQFTEILSKYPASPEAPKAVYEIGMLYADNGQYDQALVSFDRVLEEFPENPMSKDAKFRKAEQLASLGKKAEAIREYDLFARNYPSDSKAEIAMDRSRELKAPAPAAAKGKQAPAAKGKTTSKR